MAALLDSPQAQTGDETTARILDAAYEQLLAFGVRNLDVAAVAKRVGIARITVYRRFANKDELLQAVLTREAQRLFAAVDEVVDGIASPREQLVEGFAVTLDTVRRHPLIRRTLDTEPELLSEQFVANGGMAIALAREYLAARIERQQAAGDLPTFDPRPVAELAVRLSTTFLLVPESCIPMTSTDDARAFARRHLLPILDSFAPRHPEPV